MHQVKIDNQVMNLSLIFRMFSVATVLSFSAVAVRAQLKVGGREVGRFAGDTGSEIASGGSVSASEVMAGNVQFDFTYNPLFGAAGSIPLTMSAPGAPVFGALVANTARTFTSADSDKQLLYTAMTRAKRLCVIIGDKKALICAVKRASDTSRCTFLKDKIIGIKS